MIKKAAIILTAFSILEIQSIAEGIYPQNLKIQASLTDYNYKSNTEIERFFKENLNSFENIIYTIIPMGLVVSINSCTFYDEGKDKLNPASFDILNIIAKVLKIINKPCLIESSTAADSFKTSDYKTNWELSVVRADNIANYLISEKIPPDKIRANGFGEIIPFFKKGETDMTERIDFIIFNYENKFKQ